MWIALRILDLQCEHSLRALFFRDLLDLISLIVVFISVSLITRLPPFFLVLFPPSCHPLHPSPILWVFVLPPLHLIFSLPNSLRWKSSWDQIPAVTSATETVQTNSCCQYQCTIIVSGHFIPLGVWFSNVYLDRKRDATSLRKWKHDIFEQKYIVRGKPVASTTRVYDMYQNPSRSTQEK